MKLMLPINLSMEKDEWIYEINDDGIFTVNAIYVYLSNTISYSLSYYLEPGKGLLLKKLWESLAPIKVIIFS